jgi:nanoRNase/pAp phosphatase (c-di-AMP/oligoRNAs hydrolase)
LFVAFSKVGAHESAAANALRDNGVDLALVFSEQSNGYRITARASETFADRVSLGDSLLPAIADEFGGEGGGHADAGVATVQAGTPERVEQFVLQYLEQQLGITFSPVSGY